MADYSLIVYKTSQVLCFHPTFMTSKGTYLPRVGKELMECERFCPEGWVWNPFKEILEYHGAVAKMGVLVWTDVDCRRRIRIAQAHVTRVMDEYSRVASMIEVYREVNKKE